MNGCALAQYEGLDGGGDAFAGGVPPVRVSDLERVGRVAHVGAFDEDLRHGGQVEASEVTAGLDAA